MLASDPLVKQEQVQELGVELVDMDTLLRESDFVAVNTFLNNGTRRLIGEREFRLVKPTAYFINTVRGPIVQHDALVRALKEKWIAGAGIDVFPGEPPPPEDPLFELGNVIFAPHALAWTKNIMHDKWRRSLRPHPEGSPRPNARKRGEPRCPPGFLRKLERYR